MTLYRPQYTRDGKRTKARVWHVRANVGGRKRQKSTGCRDKRAAEEKARAIVRRWERRAAGMRDPFEDAQALPLAGHVADFESVLRARGVSEAHVADRMTHLRAFVAEKAPRRLGDLEPASASEWLSSIKGPKLGARAVNKRYQALRQFGRWLVKSRRLTHDPFETLKPLNEDTDRRRVRRALSAGELAQLLDAAARRPLEFAQKQRVTKGVSAAEEIRLRALGRARALLYAMAAGTGLRRNELRQLRWCDVDTTGLWVRVCAASAKSKREQRVPLRQDLAEALDAFRPGDAAATDPIVPSRFYPTSRTFQADLEAAKIQLKDEEGRVVDFHALRVTFVSSLARAGVHPRTAQALARHANVETTMKHYTDLRLLDLHGAAEAVVSGGGVLAPMLAPAPAATPRRGALPRVTSEGAKAAEGTRQTPRNSRSEASNRPMLVGSGGRT